MRARGAPGTPPFAVPVQAAAPVPPMRATRVLALAQLGFNTVNKLKMNLVGLEGVFRMLQQHARGIDEF